MPHETAKITRQIRGQHNDIFGAANYQFSYRRGQWEKATVKLTNAKGVIIGHDTYLARDYFAHHPVDGSKAPAWYLSPSVECIHLLAQSATPEGVTLEAGPNTVAVALYTADQHARKELCLARDANGQFGFISAEITQDDIDKANGFTNTEGDYGFFRAASNLAATRGISQWLGIPVPDCGSKYYGYWYDPDNACFVYAQRVDIMLENIIQRHYMDIFEKKSVGSVSITSYKDIQALVTKIISGTLRLNSLNHDAFYTLYRNGALNRQTKAMVNLKSELLPTPPGFTV